MAQLPVAVILGASTNRAKYGNKSVRAHRAAGYEVYPVNPRATEIEGMPCYPTITDVPKGRIERVSVYLPAKLTLEMIDAIADRQPDELWLNPGAESPELIAAAEERGLTVISACSIVDLGLTPAAFPDE